MRLIDADALCNALNDAGGTGAERGSWADGWDKAIDEAICLVEKAPAVEPAQQWIPVTERMPQEHQIVVGWTKDNPFSCYREEVVTWNGKGWVFVYAQRYVTNVTYWLPLPEPYTAEGKDGNG